MVDVGSTLVVDESMSKWSGHVFAAKPPHVTFMKDKPVDTGVLLRVLADGQTKVFLKLEIAEGKEAMSKKPFQARKPDDSNQQDEEYLQQLADGDLHQAHTAMVLRLVQDFFATNKLIIGDSAYFSLATVRALISHGLHGCGMVKTATKGFPMAQLKTLLEGVPEGVREKIYITELGEQKVMALGYFKDGAFSTIISSVGHTNRTTDGSNKPQVLADMRHPYGFVDDHNRYRQGYLGCEDRPTKKWEKRIADTIYGMMAVDAYLAFIHERQLAGLPVCPLFTFLQRVASPFDDKSMIANGAFVKKSSVLPQPAVQLPMDHDAFATALTTVLSKHSLRPLVDHPHYQHKRQKPLLEHTEGMEEGHEQQADANAQVTAVTSQGITEERTYKRRRTNIRIHCVSCGEECRNYCVQCSQGTEAIVGVHGIGNNIHISNEFKNTTDTCLLKHILQHL